MDRRKQIEEVLRRVLERPPEERAAFLHDACSGDSQLEREIAARLGESGAADSSGALEGQLLSHYRIVEKLGAGGMGVVWKARDTRLERFVALKLLPARRMSDPDRKRRFVQEAKAASSLNHPHIVTVYEIGDAAEGHAADFIAMEYVAGKPLDRLIARKGLRTAEVLEYGIQVADALASAHAAGIVHRDLKPGNIMVTESGQVKVVDFGLAKLTEHGGSGDTEQTETVTEAQATSEGVILGTASYMSPEQAEGKKVDARSDIFSFGAVLYEMITGRQAFAGGSMVSILSAILRDEPKPVAEIAEGAPGDLAKVVSRCLRKDPKRRYQHAGDLKIDLEQVKEELGSGTAKAAVERRARAGPWWILAAVALAAGFVIGWWARTPKAAASEWNLTRLTSDAGLSDWPALSPDGKLVAYASDRDTPGERDLYVKQVTGGQPIRLTTDGAGNTTPDFSPDGSRIVFRSNQNGGGIYEIPTFGGEVRLLARGGLNPKFSPDGSQVAYWIGDPNVALAVPGSGAVWVVASAGGQPRRVDEHFTAARAPIWLPDGRRLLILGYTSPRTYEAAVDWWIVPVNGGEPQKTGLDGRLKQVGLRATNDTVNTGGPWPACWSTTDNTVIFSMASGDSRNIWQIGISPDNGKLTGMPQRLTTGSGVETASSCTTGAFAFTSLEMRRDVWSMPFDLDRGTSAGTLERVTQGPAVREYPVVSGDGRFVAFASDQSGQLNVWRRDLTTGKETSVATSKFRERFPVINRDGSRIAYSVYQGNERLVYLAEPGGEPEKMCDQCLRATDFSADEKTLLVFGGNPYQINLLDIAARQQTLLVKRAEQHVLYARFSPDNRWISFTNRQGQNRNRIMVAPTDGARPIPESAWIPITEEGQEDWANWSPDGASLYFTSIRDGHKCIWRQRLDPATHRPSGPATAAVHLHGYGSYAPEGGWSARGGRIAVVLAEVTGNIWIMSRTAKK